jgi:hypothetical protein
MRLSELRSAMTAYAVRFDAARLAVSDVAQIVEDAAAIEKMAATVKSLAAARSPKQACGSATATGRRRITSPAPPAPRSARLATRSNRPFDSRRWLQSTRRPGGATSRPTRWH